MDFVPDPNFSHMKKSVDVMRSESEFYVLWKINKIYFKCHSEPRQINMPWKIVAWHKI